MRALQESPGRRARIGRKLIVAGISSLVVVLLIEVTFRYQNYALGGFSPERLLSLRPIGDAGYMRPAADPDVGYELEPNIDGWFLLFPFETNSVGMRDREYSLAKPSDVFRIAVI